MSNTAPLIFLGTCLGFAETTLGVLSGLVGLNVTLAAVFALSALGMVLLALVAMYFRDPAFLTFGRQEALDFRILQEIKDQMPAELLAANIDGIRLGSVKGQPYRSARTTTWTADEIGELDSGLDPAGDTE